MWHAERANGIKHYPGVAKGGRGYCNRLKSTQPSSKGCPIGPRLDTYTQCSQTCSVVHNDFNRRTRSGSVDWSARRYAHGASDLTKLKRVSSWARIISSTTPHVPTSSLCATLRYNGRSG